MKDCSIVLIKAPFEVLHQELNDCVEYNRKHNPVYCFDKAVKKTFCKKSIKSDFYPFCSWSLFYRENKEKVRN